MPAQLDAFRIDKPSRPHLAVYLRRVLAQEVAVVALDEADFHTFPFFRLERISFITKIPADLHLGERPQREDAPLQHLLPQPPEEIGLVFLVVISGNDVSLPVPLLQTGVVPGSDERTAQPVRPLRQDAELEQWIAHHTRIGSTPPAILINKVPNDNPAESIALIRHIVLNSHTVGKAAGFHRFVSPHPHGETDYLIALLPQHQTSGGTVYTSAHADQYSLPGFVHILQFIYIVCKSTRFQAEYTAFSLKRNVFSSSISFTFSLNLPIHRLLR